MHAYTLKGRKHLVTLELSICKSVYMHAMRCNFRWFIISVLASDWHAHLNSCTCIPALPSSPLSVSIQWCMYTHRKVASIVKSVKLATYKAKQLKCMHVSQ